LKNYRHKKNGPESHDTSRQRLKKTL